MLDRQPSAIGRPRISSGWLYWGALALSIALPLAFSIHLYREFIDPTEVAWLAREGDSFQHYIGWHFFRREAWSWPLGAFSTLASDVPTSIVYTDSIPLFAIPLKLLHSWLPDPFQYLGLAMLFNYALNGLFAGRLLLRLGVPALVVPLGALLLASLPAITMRGLGAHGHEALTAHWILFIAIEYSLLRARLNLATALSWGGLLVLAVLLHFYLFFMAGVLWALSMAYMLVSENPGLLKKENGGGRQRAMHWLMVLLGTPLTILLVMWSVGYFHLGGQGVGSDGYGYFSAEALAFFNPGYGVRSSEEGLYSFSALFGGWYTVYPGQYEGVSYVGAGAIVVFIAAFATLFVNGKHKPLGVPSSIPGIKPVLFSSTGMFLFAIAGEVGFTRQNIDLGYDALFGPLKDYLRSSGRLVWPAMYLSVIISLVLVSRCLRPAHLLLVMLAVVWIQKEDLAPWHDLLRESVWQRSVTAKSDPVAHSVWEDDDLDQVWEEGRHIVSFPTDNYDTLRPYLWIAAEHGMSINVAYLARISHALVEEVTQPYIEALEDGKLPEGNVYLLTQAQHVEAVCRQEDWRCRTHEEVTVAWSARHE